MLNTIKSFGAFKKNVKKIRLICHSELCFRFQFSHLFTQPLAYSWSPPSGNTYLTNSEAISSVAVFRIKTDYICLTRSQIFQGPKHPLAYK